MISLIIQLIIVSQNFCLIEGEVVDMTYVFNSETLYWPGSKNFTKKQYYKGNRGSFW